MKKFEMFLSTPVAELKARTPEGEMLDFALEIRDSLGAVEKRDCPRPFAELHEFTCFGEVTPEPVIVLWDAIYCSAVVGDGRCEPASIHRGEAASPLAAAARWAAGLRGGDSDVILDFTAIGASRFDAFMASVDKTAGSASDRAEARDDCITVMESAVNRGMHGGTFTVSGDGGWEMGFEAVLGIDLLPVGAPDDGGAQ